MTLKNLPVLSSEKTSEILDDIFEQCEIRKNDISIDELKSYCEYRKEKYGVQKIVVLVILVIFSALPFLFVYPDFYIKKTGNAASGGISCDIIVNNILPIKSVNAQLDNTSIPVYETGDRTYNVTVGKNGRLSATVTLINNQTSVIYVQVDNVDSSPPHLISSDKQSGKIKLEVEDSESGIDFDSIYAETDDGLVLKPDSVNEETGTVTFDLSHGSLNVYIPDMFGNRLHLVITVV